MITLTFKGNSKKVIALSPPQAAFCGLKHAMHKTPPAAKAVEMIGCQQRLEIEAFSRSGALLLSNWLKVIQTTFSNQKMVDVSEILKGKILPDRKSVV